MKKEAMDSRARKGKIIDRIELQFGKMSGALRDGLLKLSFAEFIDLRIYLESVARYFNAAIGGGEGGGA